MARSVSTRWHLGYWVVLVSLSTPSLCGSMAAWWTDLGPSFVLQNASTGLLTYSFCHSNSTPIYPQDPPIALRTTYAPKNGTALAATGWYDQIGSTWASVFYQNNNDDIVNAVYKCDNRTGLYEQQETNVISDRIGTPNPHTSTGLSVTLLGEQEGYRVFYHDRAKALQSLQFQATDGWSYGSPVSSNTNRSSMEIHSMFSGVRNVTVVTPRDAKNMETARLNVDSTYFIETFPASLRGGMNNTSASNRTSFPYDTSATPSFELEAWDGTPKAIGIAIDTKLTRHIFYIGTDRAVHWIAAFVSGKVEGGFRAQPGQNAEIWPLADEPNSDFTIASHIESSSIRLYYVSDGRIIETRYRDGNWATAIPVETSNTTVIVDEGTGGGDVGLTAGAKAGIGVGVSVGVLLIGAAAAAFWILRRKKTAPPDEETTTAPDPAATTGPPMSETGSPDATSFGAEVARTGSGLSGDKWDAEVKDKAVTPPPRELESPNLASELPEIHDRNELPTKHHVTELP
ncbi:hypothetical protein QBC40DRAFT_60958 [Triangularia verruculosa]|uniref:Fucose-specific lectin n=1 Tax=Triangularia verruculosa TaxID=2587418 RepID=A0AAN6XKX9_9PEZI|nr:hypothetical protein QBC40DRAFT_60958 [Triangularia verruculosa]